ncbi:zinc finger BED domain-containing protein RICESLEEPER 1-like [Gastrolobium bilobum]|uniref:zinc finger BED domain-containing protein RICESLEEPER 1-like n=1 Tax=Gastrolobium bilobum TaxID=150636 RepID=UPI002AB1FAA6|nr:zinc finger BED domain-containing protein RICESLEEPER 1-like [Gastrolobium bilobum]
MDFESHNNSGENMMDHEVDVQDANVEGDNTAGSTGTKAPTKKPRKLVSKVWQHFERIPINKDGCKIQAKCKYCDQLYMADSKYGTGNLKRHLDGCVRRDTRDVGQMMLSTQNSSFSLEPKFDHEKFRELLIAAIIMHDLPFQFTEWQGIRTLLLYLRADLNIITRNTVKADCVKLHKREKDRCLNMLKENTSRVSLTSDLWTSLNTDGFICLTAHFVDKSWHLHKRVLNFGFMPPPHTGISLAEKIHTFLKDWGLDGNFFSITLDNASANDVCVQFLRDQLLIGGGLLCNGEFFHVRCCAHILNLIVQEGLKEVDASIVKVRESVKYVKGSQARKQKFLQCVAQSSLASRRGCRQDVPTRWNSTFLMLDSALFYKRAFMHLELSDSNYKYCPSRDEWDRIEKINEFLHVFYDITCVFSKTKHPTANLYFPYIFTAHLTLQKGLKSDDAYIVNMAEKMFTKFDKYWSEFSMILAIAVILDPRYKMSFVEWCYNKLYGDDGVNESTKVKDKLVSLFNEYANDGIRNYSSISSTRRATDGGSETIDETSISTTSRDVLSEFDTFHEVVVPQKTQLELYLEDPRIDRRNISLDVLSYWKANQFRYPEVAAMARDIFGIPISSVASESAFSVGGRVLDQYRSSLKPDIVEALICTRDWLYGEQEQSAIALEELTEDIMDMNLHSIADHGAQNYSVA